MEKRKRSLWAHGYKVSDNTFVRMGKGISEMELNYNPTENQEKYIDEDVATNSVDEYAPAFDNEQTCYKDEPIFECLNALRLKLATGSDAEGEIINIDVMDKQSDGSYTAQKFACTTSINSYDGTKIKYKISLNGSPTNGKATIGADKKITFTEASSTSASSTSTSSTSTR